MHHDRTGMALSSCAPPHDAYPFCNASLPEDTRLDDLVSRLTLDELVGMLFMNASLAYGAGSAGRLPLRGGGGCGR
jgi:hypothetical protein